MVVKGLMKGKREQLAERLEQVVEGKNGGGGGTKHGRCLCPIGVKGLVHKTVVRKGAIFLFSCRCCVELHMQRKRLLHCRF